MFGQNVIFCSKILASEKEWKQSNVVSLYFHLSFVNKGSTLVSNKLQQGKLKTQEVVEEWLIGT